MTLTSQQPQTKFTGNITLYISQYKTRTPVFLQRNINKVLQYHHRHRGSPKLYEGEDEMRGSGDDTPSSRPGPDSSPVAPLSSGEWSVDEILQILNTKAFGPQDPVLRIDVTDIKDKLAKFRAVKPDQEPPRKQARTSRIRANCGLTIWDTATKHGTVIEQSRCCDIYTKVLPDGERGASITLDEPFMVHLNQLEPHQSRSTHTLSDVQFSMQLVVMVANAHDTWPPVEMRLPPAKIKTDSDSTGLVRFPVLAAKWHKIPRVPVTEQERVLDLVASQDNTPYRPKLGLRIDATWCKAPSPLEVSNAEIRRRSSIPKPVSTLEPKTLDPETKIRIDWKFEGLTEYLRDIQFSGFNCPLCAAKQFKEAFEFHFHLINSHVLFKFAFSLQFKSEEGRSVAEGVVSMDLADDYASKVPNTYKRVKDCEVLDSWEKPKTPLDLEAYLNGDESWLGKKTKRSGNLLVAHAAPPPGRSRSNESSKAQIPFSAVTRDPEKVPDIVMAPKRKFIVPKAPPSTRFFRLLTKRLLEEGEEVSESDDDIDEEWLMEKHADTIDSFTDTTRDEKAFIQRFDRHMLKEDVSSDLHSGEALIRFCRLHARWLQQDCMRIEFHKKAATLKIQGRIGRKTIWACMKIIDSAPSKDTDAMDVDSPSDHPAHRDAHTPPPESGGDLYGHCNICHAGIYHPRTYICCSNALCPRPDFHFVCVSLTHRPPGWLCTRCISTTPPQTFHDVRRSASGSKTTIPLRSAENSPSEDLERARSSNSNGKGKEKATERAEMDGNGKGKEAVRGSSQGSEPSTGSPLSEDHDSVEQYRLGRTIDLDSSSEFGELNDSEMDEGEVDEEEYTPERAWD